ncbi:MAG: extracellular solute-binding protein [Candidatus Brocadiales bacterium]|nr:extracellular solute-binding protein [Candidatus Brocadiales bacterium]
MITSTNPDPLRTYELEERIPFLLEDIDSLGIRIENVIDTFESITGEKGEFNSILSNVAILLRKMVSRPQSIPGNLANFRDGVGSIGTWLTNVKKQPLQIDYLLLAGVDDILPKTKPNFFQALLHEIRAFISSFTVDQNNLSKTIDESEKNKEDDLHIWLGLGRDQAQLLRQMLDDSFNPETNIAVNLELVENMGGLLIPSILAKTNPDVALGAANMDLAFRGALYDISQFPDFEDVITRFSNSALTGFTFQDQVFALPEVQSFPMLFYRKDILNELGFSIPQTWDDIYKILPILQERNMNFGLLPNMYNYMIFLYQRRVPLYKEDNIAVNLSSEQAIAAFQEMTDLFLLYDLPIEFNLVNRFRMGEMPLVIADYNQYNILSVFAPELNGKWGIAPVPGIRETDGTINRTVPVTQSMLIGTTIPAGTTGSVIFSNSDNKNEAWDFLKWWTRKDTQARFGFEMEALIGSAARWATANKEALKMLPWRPEERMNLEAQWEWVEGIPPLLGGYYVPRHFDWLFRDVVLTYMPLRDSVLDYTDKINHEITRKRDEFNLITNYDELTDELKDLYWKTYTHVNVLDWQLDEAGERRYVDGD